MKYQFLKIKGYYIYVDEIETLYSEYIALDIIHPNGKDEYKP